MKPSSCFQLSKKNHHKHHHYHHSHNHHHHNHPNQPATLVVVLGAAALALCLASVQAAPPSSGLGASAGQSKPGSAAAGSQQVPNGAQLFQSPNALAAMAAAAAAAAASAHSSASNAPAAPALGAPASASSGAQLALAPSGLVGGQTGPSMQASPVVMTSASSLNQSPQLISSNSVINTGPSTVPSGAAAASAASSTAANSVPGTISARVDTNELLKQAVQQSQQLSAAQQAGSIQQQQASSSSAAAAAAAIGASSPQSFEQECAISGGFISFELITGYVLGAPAESMIMQPGTLQLTDCLNLCRQNASCLAINFETGLCVLLQESADKNPQALQKSQFPVFTIYAHKICLQGDRMNRCHKSWSFERVIGWVLNNLEKKTILTKTRLECLQACYSEQSFQCKSFNYDSASGSCSLSDMDRHSLPSNALRRRHYVESTIDTIDYGENNCIQEARGICDFKPLQNRILKTVDSIYQDIKTEAECRKRCLQASYRCHSYDLGDSSNPVCRTSHLDRTSLQQIQEPYLEIQGAVSYELDSCYNVTVQCKSREMIARVRTNKLFNGKIYAKNAPLSCVNDISNSMDFELNMAFQDNCAIQRSASSGVFSNEIVLQHNDMIVTNSDMGLNVKCQYDLRNQTVYNNINLDDFMSGREPIDIASQSAVVRSPNISMQILRHDGNQITSAQVGDPLLLRFQITDDRSPFEIFVRDLYAMDGAGGAEIMLIDSEGCPTDPTIMAAMSQARSSGQSLEAQFDAFKFPTSETVAFRGLVTPCIPHCEPVHCQNRVYDGTIYEAESYGKKRRRRRRSVGGTDSSKAISSASGQQPEEVVVRNSIEIRDKFFPDQDSAGTGTGAGAEELRKSSYELASDSARLGQHSSSLLGRLGEGYLRAGGLMFMFGALLLAQAALLAAWLVSGKRQQQQQLVAPQARLSCTPGAAQRPQNQTHEVRMCRH